MSDNLMVAGQASALSLAKYTCLILLEEGTNVGDEMCNAVLRAG
jgi:hypothetical protein